MSFALANLPPVSALSTALRAMDTGVASTGTVIIKMDKVGRWVYGAAGTVAHPEATWAINPFSFIHGFIAWGPAVVLGEVMVPATEPLPELEPAPSGAPKGWEAQVGLSVKCMSGDDVGMEARFTTTSVGGRKAIQALAVAIAEQVEKDQSKPVPVVILKTDSYQHKKYGRIPVPIFEVVDWISMDGTATTEAEVAADEPARRRRA